MDGLRALILLLHLKESRAADRVRIAELERQLKERSMTPKIAGVKQALAVLHHEIDKQAEDLANKIEAGRQRTQAVFADTSSRVQKDIESMQAEVGEINDFLDSLVGDNGSPQSAGSETQSSPGPTAPAASGQ